MYLEKSQVLVIYVDTIKDMYERVELAQQFLEERPVVFLSR